jgi:hypothetical protein
MPSVCPSAPRRPPVGMHLLHGRIVNDDEDVCPVIGTNKQRFMWDMITGVGDDRLQNMLGVNLCMLANERPGFFYDENNKQIRTWDFLVRFPKYKLEVVTNSDFYRKYGLSTFPVGECSDSAANIFSNPIKIKGLDFLIDK